MAELCLGQSVSTRCRRIVPSSDGIWIHVLHDGAARRRQGWKIHVTAGGPAADTLLRRAMPVLLAEQVEFKVAASPDILMRLNQGGYGESQVGKFITVYPHDDAQAVRLAMALDAETRGLRGPAVPSDRPLRPGSLVYYRYGGFSEQYVQTPLGEILPALSTPDGEIIPDRRTTTYHAPTWAVDPFVAAGFAAEAVVPGPLIGGRYLLVGTVCRTPRGAVHLAVDLDGPRRCVLKRAARDAMISVSGADARDRLRHEAAVLAELAPDPRFPAASDLVEYSDDLFLVMNDVEGETLESYVRRLAAQGRFVPGEQVVAWGRELAQALDTIHAHGLLYRDLKSTNVIVAPDGHLRIIDFELAYRPGSDVLFDGGTPGYSRLQREAGEPATIEDDMYAVGALLYFMATGAEPSQAPRSAALLSRPLEAMNPAIGPALQQAITRCLAPTPAEHVATMSALDGALADAVPAASRTAVPFGGEGAGEAPAGACVRYLTLAGRVGDTLCQVAQRQPDGRGVAWASSHTGSVGVRARDINTGNAGTVLALAELVAALDRQEHRTTLGGAARWLAAAPPLSRQPLAGLYIGEAGIAAALLRAGQVLDDHALIALAAERGRWIATLPYTTPDLFHGTAGRLRLHLLLWDETAAQEHLHHALAAGESLLTMAEDAGDGGLRWTIPPGYDTLSGMAYLGYAHGAAGIADALLDLFDATHEERYFATAQGAGHWLTRLASPGLDDGSGLNWPTVENGAPSAAFWCHGATGIGTFFLHAAECGMLGAEDLAARAARCTARGTRWASPTQCHGLAGNIEFLLDMAQVTGDHAYLAEARSLGRLLEAFAVERDGALFWPSETPDVFTPDYMVGYAGVAVCLLRLGDPAGRPRQLSRRGFQFHRRQNVIAALAPCGA